MDDMDIRVNEYLHEPQAGSRTKIDIFEIEAELFVHATQISIYVGGHQPEHTCNPIRVDDAIRVWQIWLEDIARQSTLDQIKGCWERAAGILHGASIIHDLGGDQICIMRLKAGEQ